VTIYLRNVTNRALTSWIQIAPEVVGDHGRYQTQVLGASAEWIVEAPVNEDRYLGQFGDVYIDACFALTNNGAVLTGGDGILSYMYAASGPHLADAQVQNQWLIKVSDP
jgi:hypothetical protein